MEAASGPVVALVGNPNVGKSTLFNALTHLRQHTGNWPGKTVEVARGSFSHRGVTYTLIDLPGAYSLHPGSAEEEVTRDFLLSGEAEVTLVVVDATCLERNLPLVLQVMETAWPVAVCVNLMDEAARKQIHIDLPKLQDLLGCPVAGAAGAAGFYALVIIANKRVQHLSGIHCAMYELIVSFFVVLAFLAVTGARLPVITAGSELPWVLVLGLVNTGLAYYLYFSAMQCLSGQTVALLCYIDPLTALVLSALVLHERLLPLQIAGAALILGGACLGELRLRRRGT